MTRHTLLMAVCHSPFLGMAVASALLLTLHQLLRAVVRTWERERFVRHTPAERRDIVELERAMRHQR